jgi:hypothetical protein
MNGMPTLTAHEAHERMVASAALAKREKSLRR